MFPEISRPRWCRGFTLIELIVTLVVLAVTASAALGVYTNLIRRSADPVLQQQALAIAEAYMEEIRLKPFNDPDGDDDETAGGLRDLFDDVNDYDGLTDSGAAGQDGVGINGLEDYTVTVSVDNDALATIGAADSLRIRVVVSHPAIDPIQLTSYRVNY